VLFETRPELVQIVKERVIPVQGDLIQEGLGILPEVRKALTEELDVIINSAASVSFHDHLLDAIQINYMGAVRVLALAHECKKLLVLSHVSTAYVGSNLP
jgi:fatty acyl-CoA reductase